MCWQKIGRILWELVIVGIVLLGVCRGAIAADFPTAAGLPTRPPLTLTLLDQRLANPVREEGALVVDLRELTIDLRSDGEATPPEYHLTDRSKDIVTAEQFYQRLRKGLNGTQPLGIDLRGSLIQGNFALPRLSLRVSAYSDATLPALEAFKQAFQPAKGVLTGQATPALTPSLSTKVPTGALSRSLLLQPQPTQLDSFVVQGPLLLNQTVFDGEVDAANLYFLSPVEADRAIFTRRADWHDARFARSASFIEGQFQQESSFRSALFASRTRFNQASFSGQASWQEAVFHRSASFAQVDFQAVTFARSHWKTNADFEQAAFHAPVSFQKSRFDQALFLTDAQLEAAVTFRQAQFQQSLSLRGAHILSRCDFGDARFAATAAINVADLDFSAGEAAILGSPGQIGKVFSVPALASNETVLQNLVRNFRLLEQISDANQLEYTTERLRLRQIERQISGVSLNHASAAQLMKVGFSEVQAAAVAAQADRQPFVTPADLLGLDDIDLATYLRVRDRLTTQPTNPISRAQSMVRWLLLAGILLLSDYGTNVGLTFSVGLMATALFAVFFWSVDRYRQLVPTPTVPTRVETVAVAVGGSSLFILALSILSQSSRYPGRTLVAVMLVVLPVPVGLLARLYQQGHDSDLTDSYFVENGALRRLQVLIARLPVIPKYPFYRDRYLPLLTSKRWNWLNYFDFSVNNWFKFGFNDIRLRDRAVPGLVSALVWYQWSLGILYIVLLLWTLSRTIPGLNLLLYF